jgi:hypothetical protein
MRRDRNAFGVESGIQECSLCAKVKPFSEFSGDKKRIGGIRGACKECRAGYRRSWSGQRLVRLREDARAEMGTTQTCVRCEKVKPLCDFPAHPTSRTGVSKKCRECIARDATKEVKLTAVPGYRHDRTLRRSYGIGREEYLTILEAQGGVCAICRKPERRKIARGKPTNLCVDHNHRTGKIRGLLCAGCNAAIGHLNDDIAVVVALIDYLKMHTE